MSSFSSVVHKPGKKIAPKAAPRRNVQRRHARVDPPEPTIPADIVAETGDDGTSTNDPSIGDDGHQDETAVPESTHSVPVIVTHSIAEPEDDLQTWFVPPLIETALPVAPASPLRVDAPKTATEETIEIDEPDASHQAPATPPSAATVRRTRIQTPRGKRGQKRSIPVAEANNEAPNRDSPRLTTDDTTVAGVIESHENNAQVAEPSARAGKRRKVNQPNRASPARPEDISTESRLSAVPPSPLRRSSRHSRRSQQPMDLLQSATQRAASVSELASDIETRTRSLRSQSVAETISDGSSEHGTAQSRTSSPPNPRSKRKRRKKTVQEQAAEVVANAVGSAKSKKPRSKNRSVTPEDAAEHELEPDEVKMGDLCEDSRLGKKSTLEAEMQANWPEILQRRKEDRERAIADAAKRQRKAMGRGVGADLLQEPVAALAPAMTVVNGVIVVDQSSREIDRSAQLQQVIDDNTTAIREDKDYYKYVNQNTVGRKPGHGSYSKWDTESTELFFQGLRTFGTDFLMISNMFPSLTRKQIKAKFIREEKADKARVQECLRNHESVPLEEYAQLANKEAEKFYTLESIQKELEDDEKKLREEDNERRKREGFTTNNVGANEESAAENGAENVAEGPSGSAEPGRFDSVTREIVEAAMAPKKRQRKATATNNKRGSKHGRRPEGGVEEVLGSITEVAV